MLKESFLKKLKNSINYQNHKLNNPLSKIPSVERILQDKNILSLIKILSRKTLTDIIRKIISEEKKQFHMHGQLYSAKERIDRIKEYAKKEQSTFLNQVINGSGVILHTNLGRAPLGREIYSILEESLRGYSNLEYNLFEGKRGHRGESVEKLLCTLSKAESSLVVNNNAGAIFLILNSLAKDKEVIVSRGELVQIGGGFRIPDILKQSGAKLVEIGTTNQTFIKDYENAIRPQTAFILKVHQSNFKMDGFTNQVDVKRLKLIGRKYKLPIVVDLGSGTFLNSEDFGLKHEPTVQENIKHGAEIVCFSSDKLLGGPQGGIICGKEKYLKKLYQNPVFRALRVGKLTLFLLQEVLLTYLKNEATSRIPIWKMISCPLDVIRTRNQKIYQELIKENIPVFLKEGQTAIGGGSLPGQTLPTQLIYIKPSCSLKSFSKELRLFNPPLLGRKEKEYFVLDPRSFETIYDELVIKIIKKVYSKTK